MVSSNLYKITIGGWESNLQIYNEKKYKFGEIIESKFDPFISKVNSLKITSECLIVTNLLEIVHPQDRTEFTEFLSKWQNLALTISSVTYDQKPSHQSSKSMLPFALPDINSSLMIEPLYPKRTQKLYGLLVEKDYDENSWINIYIYILFLASCWHVKQQGLCLHSSAVSWNQRGFLFLGESGSGKSTIAKQGLDLGIKVLGDDLNFIYPGNMERYFVSAGPSSQPLDGAYSQLHAPVNGIFKLVQSNHNFLKVISQKDAAKVLWESFYQSPVAAKLPHWLKQIAFQTCCKVARTIPTYELHFCKSQDFWQLIHEQFPD